MGVMKTPGVYVVEQSPFPNSVVQVPTAVPAFIGYTEKADDKGKSLINQPWKITSMAEFQAYFGFAPSAQFSLTEAQTPTAESRSLTSRALELGGKPYALNQLQGKYLLYYSMMLFYQNGGGPCYVVSVGDYSDVTDQQKIKAGMDALCKEAEPTMLVVPDAVLLSPADCVGVQQHMLDHCGNVMKNRVAILDIPDGYKDRKDSGGDPVAAFRDSLGSDFLGFAAAYYPWIEDDSYSRPANLVTGILTKRASACFRRC